MRRLLQRYHPIVWWVVGLHAMFGLCFMFLVPAYRAPDEIAHVDMARQYRDGPLLPDPTKQLELSPGVMVSTTLMGTGRKPRPPLSAAEAAPRPERPSYDDLDRLAEPAGRNQMSQHPPLYYAAQSGVVSMVEGATGAMSWDTQLLLYRVVTWLGTLLLPLLAAEGALALGFGRESSGVTAAVTLCVPMATFIGSMANNDGFVMIATGAAVVGGLGFVRKGGWHYATLASIGCAAAPLSKSTGAPAVAWVALLVAVGAIAKAERRRSSQLALIAGGVLVGGSWHLSNVLRFADPQPNGFGFTNSRARADTGLLEFLPEWVTRANATFWGRPAVRTGVTLPDWTLWMLAAAMLGLAAFAAVRARPRWPTIAMGGLVIATVAIMFRTNYRAHLRTGWYPGVQGRYLFPLLIPLALILTAGLVALVRRRSVSLRPAATAIAACGVGLHLLLGWSMLTAGFWDDDSRGATGFVQSVLAWSPLPVGLTGTVFVATAALVVAAATAAFRQVRDDRTHSTPGGVAT